MEREAAAAAAMIACVMPQRKMAGVPRLFSQPSIFPQLNLVWRSEESRNRIIVRIWL